MDVTQTTVPGVGVLHHCVTRAGQHFRMLVGRSGERQVFVYESAESTESFDIVLDGDEADQVADILHSRPIPDRMADLERRFSELAARTP